MRERERMIDVSKSSNKGAENTVFERRKWSWQTSASSPFLVWDLWGCAGGRICVCQRCIFTFAAKLKQFWYVNCTLYLTFLAVSLRKEAVLSCMFINTFFWYYIQSTVPFFAEFGGTPDPLHGNLPYQAVRKTAKVCVFRGVKHSLENYLIGMRKKINCTSESYSVPSYIDLHHCYRIWLQSFMAIMDMKCMLGTQLAAMKI